VTAVEPPPPWWVAAAIAELGADKVRQAKRYLGEWEALAEAGVPRADIRQYLAEPSETEPLIKLRAWAEQSEQGLLCIMGYPGTGKGFAAGWWTLDRHRRGLFTHWFVADRLSVLSINERQEALARIIDVQALVLDDIGSGATRGDMLRDQLCSMVKIRIDQNRPTVVLSNGTADELSGWLGPRIIDRCRVAGGFVEVASRDSLRSKLTIIKLDEFARGPEWHEAKQLVDLVGCEPVERYDTDGRLLAVEDEVGGALQNATRREGYAACRRVRELLDLDQRTVMARAEQLEKKAKLRELEEGTFESKCEKLLARLTESIRNDKKEREAQINHRIEARTTRGPVGVYVDPYENVQPPEWAKGPEGQAKLHKLGFRVEPAEDLFILCRIDRDECKPILDGTFKTPDDAWDYAARFCAEIFPKDPAGAQAPLHKIQDQDRKPSGYPDQD
jgi:hypothetical protein